MPGFRINGNTPSAMTLHAPQSLSSRGGTIRAVESRDFAEVAALFQRTFRDPSTPPPPSLVRYMQDIFLGHPWLDEGSRSKVYLNADGAVTGFIGIVPVRMMLGDRPVTAAYAGSYMVDRPHDNPLAGARLLRAFLSGPQDLFVSETANATALGMWQKLGHRMEPAYSLNWIRIFKPANTGIDVLARKFGAARLARPVAGAFDWLMDRAMKGPLRPHEPDPRRFRAEDADIDMLTEALGQLSRSFTLRPDWSSATLDWLLKHASQKKLFGEMHGRVLRYPDGTPAGCSIYFGRPNGIAWALQVLATPDANEAVVDDMFHDACRRGFAAIRGNGDREVLPVVMRRKALLFSRSSMLVSSRDPAILSEIRSGRSIVTGLGGESWCRLVGDRFA